MKKLLFVFLIVIGGIPAVALAQVLDPSFAQGGILFEEGGAAGQITILPSGDIIIAGGYTQSNIGYSFLGFKVDGSVNHSFGNNGRVRYLSDTFSPDRSINSIFKKNCIFFPGTNSEGWAVVKYDTLGNKQLGFGKNSFIGGILIQFLDAFAIDIQDRLIASKVVSSIQGQGVRVIRFLPNGDIDSTFGDNGSDIIVTENYGSDVDGIFVLPDGRIFAGESGGGGVGIWMSVRFMPNGGPDYNYGDSGKVVLPLPGYYMRGTIVQPDKKVLQWGDKDSLMVIRLKENGSFDSSFGTNGKMRYPQAKMRTMLLMDDGRIVLGGDTEDSMFAIYRLMPNGKLDTSFGLGGMVRIKLRPSGEHQMNDLAIQSDGKLLAGGYTSNGLSYPNWVFYFTLARFMPDGRLDVSFVPPVSNSAGILLYPNPTEKTLLIRKMEAAAGKVQLQILDITGHVVLKKQLEQMTTQPVEIGVGDLVPGMYQVILKEASGKTWREPFLKN